MYKDGTFFKFQGRFFHWSYRYIFVDLIFVILAFIIACRTSINVLSQAFMILYNFYSDKFQYAVFPVLSAYQFPAPISYRTRLPILGKL